MSIIQAIREKGSWLIITLVVLSLIGFILMDASVGRSGLFGNQPDAVGEIAGRTIPYIEYQDRYQRQQGQYERTSGPMDEYTQLSFANQVWTQIKEDIFLSDVASTIGINVEENELAAILTGDIELDFIKSIPTFQNPQTRQFDQAIFQEFITNFKQNAQRDSEAQNSFRDFLKGIKQAAIKQRYMGMLYGVEHFPFWLKQYHLDTARSRAVKASVLSVPYYKAGIDSIQVTDEKLQSLSEKYESVYLPKEARVMKYIVSAGKTTGEDTAAILVELTTLKPLLAKTKNPSELFSQTSAQIQYSPELYTTEDAMSQLFSSQLEQIKTLSPSEVLGPFLASPVRQSNRQYYNLVRVLGKKRIPQTASVRHILVAFGNGQERVRSQEEAKNRIDSVVTKLQSGEAFESLVSTYSDDDASKPQGGGYTFTYASDFLSLDTAFRRTAFYAPAGTKKIIQSAFGYHYIEVLNRGALQQGYELVIASLPLQPSVATETQASNKANQFSIVAKSAGFEATANSQDLEVSISPPLLHSRLASMPRIGYSNSLVRWLFTNELGTISAPMKVGDNYVVAQVDEVKSRQDYLLETLRTNSFNLKKEKAVQAMPPYTSIQEVADSNAVTPYQNVTISSAKSTITPTESVRWSEPALIGHLVNNNKVSGKLLGPFLGNQAIYYAEINSEKVLPPNQTELNLEYSIRYFQHRNAIKQQILSGYMDMLPQSDNRYAF